MSNENLIDEGNKRKSGKRGETTRKIIRLLIEKPRSTFYEIANEINCSYHNVYQAFEKLKRKPELAVLYGYDAEDICIILSLRNRKRKSVVKKESTWRGKANWPAFVVATKRSLTTSELVKACGQHYTYKNGKYELTDKDINTIPKSVSLVSYL